MFSWVENQIIYKISQLNHQDPKPWIASTRFCIDFNLILYFILLFLFLSLSHTQNLCLSLSFSLFLSLSLQLSISLSLSLSLSISLSFSQSKLWIIGYPCIISQNYLFHSLSFSLSLYLSPKVPLLLHLMQIYERFRLYFYLQNIE